MFTTNSGVPPGTLCTALLPLSLSYTNTHNAATIGESKYYEVVYGQSQTMC